MPVEHTSTLTSTLNPYPEFKLAEDGSKTIDKDSWSSPFSQTRFVKRYSPSHYPGMKPSSTGNDNAGFELDLDDSDAETGDAGVKGETAFMQHVWVVSELEGIRNKAIRKSIPNGDVVTGKKDDAANKEKCRKPKKPLYFCDLVVRRPKLIFGITLGLHILMLVITLVLYVSGYDIFPTKFENIPMELMESDVYIRQVAWLNRQQSDDLYDRSTAIINVTERSVRYTSHSLNFIFEKKGGNVFTKKNLEAMRDFEDSLYNDDKYQRYCFLLKDETCDKLLSVIRFFDGTFSRYNPVFNDTEFSNIPQVFAAAENYPTTKRMLQYFLGNDSIVNTDIVVSQITRSVLYFGYPLPGFVSLADHNHRQRAILERFIVDEYGEQLEQLSEDGVGEMRFIYGNVFLYWQMLHAQVTTDMMFVGGSFTFIFIFMWIQTASLWLTAWGMLGILFSFVTGNLIYNCVFDFKYLGIFHVLSLFIILGVGADDVFIFCDTWKALNTTPYTSLSHRLSDAYKRAAATMFVTSFTTAAAFFTTSFSPILAISSFGTFSGITVLANYFSVIVFYPCVVVIWHLNWEHKPCRKNKNVDAEKDSPIRALGYSHASVLSKPELDVITKYVEIDTSKDPDLDDAQSHRKLIRFLSGPYYNFIINKSARVLLLLVFICLVSTFAYYITELTPDSKTPQVLRKDHNMEIFQDRNTNAFKPTVDEANVKVFLVWGIKTQNLSSCHPRRFDIDCAGTTVWDESFDLNPAPAQKALLDFCNKLLTMPEWESSRYQIKRDVVTNVPNVQCFLSTMDDFMKTLDQPEHDMHVPLTEVKMREFIKRRPQLYDMSLIPETYYRYFETAYGYWITNEYSNETAPLGGTSDIYSSLIGESLDKHDSHEVIGRNGAMYGTRLRYAAIAVNLTIKIAGISYSDGLALYKRWTDMLEAEKQNLPPSLQGVFHVTPYAWHWFHVQATFVQQGIITVGAGVAVAWAVLVISSGNLIVGTMATFAIGLVTVCVIGLIPMMGLKLGVLEAINMTLVVGLSVDYAVHLGMAYTYAPVVDRKGRVRYALREMGLSVVSGAITTLGSGFFMMFAQVVFFMQFGIFIFATIGFSIVFAMTFFLVFLSLVGPQGETGMTRPILRRLFNKLRGISIDAKKCPECEGKGYIEKDINANT